MNWWKKALIGTGILLILVAGLGFAVHLHIQRTSANTQIADKRDDAMGSVCGQISGAGMVVIWIVAYKRRAKHDPVA